MNRNFFSLLTLVIFMMILSACNPFASSDISNQELFQMPNDTENGIGGEEELWEDASGTAVTRARIIVSQIDFKDETIITSVSLLVPQELFNADIRVNDQGVFDAKRDETSQLINIPVPMTVQDETVEISFLIDGNVEASCTLNMTAEEPVTGDCSW